MTGSAPSKEGAATEKLQDELTEEKKKSNGQNTRGARQTVAMSHSK